MSWLNGPKLVLRQTETKLNLQNFFLQDHVFSPSGSSASISVTPICCWLNTSECCGIDPVVYPFYYLFSHPKAAFGFDSTTLVEKHKFSSPFAVRGRINGCEIHEKPTWHGEEFYPELIRKSMFPYSCTAMLHNMLIEYLFLCLPSTFSRTLF